MYEAGLKYLNGWRAFNIDDEEEEEEVLVVREQERTRGNGFKLDILRSKIQARNCLLIRRAVRWDLTWVYKWMKDVNKTDAKRISVVRKQGRTYNNRIELYRFRSNRDIGKNRFTEGLMGRTISVAMWEVLIGKGDWRKGYDSWIGYVVRWGRLVLGLKQLLSQGRLAACRLLRFLCFSASSTIP